MWNEVIVNKSYSIKIGKIFYNFKDFFLKKWNNKNSFNKNLRVYGLEINIYYVYFIWDVFII